MFWISYVKLRNNFQEFWADFYPFNANVLLWTLAPTPKQLKRGKKLDTVVTPGLLLPDCYILGSFEIFWKFSKKYAQKHY